MNTWHCAPWSLVAEWSWKRLSWSCAKQELHFVHTNQLKQPPWYLLWDIASNFLMSNKVDFCRNTDGFIVTVLRLLTKGLAHLFMKQEKKRSFTGSLWWGRPPYQIVYNQNRCSCENFFPVLCWQPHLTLSHEIWKWSLPFYRQILKRSEKCFELFQWGKKQCITKSVARCRFIVVNASCRFNTP